MDADEFVVRLGVYSLCGLFRQMWLVNKIPGELVTRSDPSGRKTLFQRLEQMEIPNASSLLAVVCIVRSRT